LLVQGLQVVQNIVIVVFVFFKVIGIFGLSLNRLRLWLLRSWLSVRVVILDDGWPCRGRLLHLLLGKVWLGY